MSRFRKELPTSEMEIFKKLNKDIGSIMGEMTKAGADVVAQNVRATAPNPDLRNHVKETRVYKTPSDRGINTKVFFSGYIPFKGNRQTFTRRNRSGGKVYSTDKGIPAEFLAIMYEYGRSTSPFPKKPFFRKAFKAKEIEKAMLQAQKRASGGILE